MTTIVTRIGKGSRLTYDEADENFNNLNDDKLEASNNLNEVDDISARSSLGLGSMSLQDSNNVSITGGAINGNSTIWYWQSITATKWVM